MILPSEGRGREICTWSTYLFIRLQGDILVPKKVSYICIYNSVIPKPRGKCNCQPPYRLALAFNHGRCALHLSR